AIILTLGLAPLVRSMGVESLHVTTLQGLSGAGYPGVASLDIVDNLVPFIGGEEEKLESEPCKMLGSPDAPLELPIQATCTRVAVREGHTESVHVRLRRPATLDGLRAAWGSFRGPTGVQALPTAPREPIHVLEEADRPQPRRDRDREGGMAVSVGRVRLSGDGRDLRFVLLGHNTIRGAAGQSVLNAEWAHAQGLLT
ncbi:MAG: Asd/ArgC dimerization domain-containing protein, partial [Thermoplasmatota archaeon]